MPGGDNAADDRRELEGTNPLASGRGSEAFSQLRRDLPGVTQKMLTRQLRELERHELVTRKVYPQVPPKVEYGLTPRGRSLLPVVASMCDWGKRWESKLD